MMTYALYYKANEPLKALSHAVFMCCENPGYYNLYSPPWTINLQATFHSQ